MSKEYQPSPEDLNIADEAISDEQREMSKIREEGYNLAAGKAKEEIPRYLNPKELTEDQQQYLMVPIDMVGLKSLRNRNALINWASREGKSTVADIVRMSPGQFLMISNIGRTGFNEMNDWLQQRGLRLGMLEPVAKNRVAGVEAIDDTEDVEGIKAGHALDFLKKMLEKTKKDKPHISDQSDSIENKLRAAVLEPLVSLVRINPYLSANALYTIEMMINNFADVNKFKENNGRENEVAMQIATYLNSLPVENGK